jgi:hypothetical protein
VRNALLPFTFTRPVADILIGMMTFVKMGNASGIYTTTLTEEYLSEISNGQLEVNVMINASFA